MLNLSLSEIARILPDHILTNTKKRDEKWTKLVDKTLLSIYGHLGMVDRYVWSVCSRIKTSFVL